MTEQICTALARVIENNPELGHISKQAIEDGIAHLYYLQSEVDRLANVGSRVPAADVGSVDSACPGSFNWDRPGIFGDVDY